MATVLLIGASRGIGLELARQYLADGWRVIATARDDAGLERLQALGAETLRLDVANPASNSGLAWQLDGEKIELAIYVAGVMDRASANTPPTLDRFDAVMHTNVLGAMRVLPTLAEALSPQARLAVISSRMGSMALRANPSGWLYRASKAALNSVLKDTSLALAGRATCVALHPGWVRTDMGGSGADLDVADAVAAMRRTLAGLQSADNGGFFDHDGTPLAW